MLVGIKSITPKALANFSPGLERSDNPGYKYKNKLLTLKGFLPASTSLNFLTLSGLERFLLIRFPGFSQARTLG